MRFLSLFSGIEAASVSAQNAGFEAAAFAEVEPFPSAVLAHRFPHVPNLGDVTKYKEWPDIGPIDLICGGSPCQDYSVAGRRLGMAGDRGQLTLTYIEILARYRPNWMVFENVPGVLSSNAGRDFARLLGDISGQAIKPPKDGWKNSGIVSGIGAAYGLAYRVLDAQYVRTSGFSRAVPQRRRRVFVVGYLGDWRPAAAVLFEPEGLQGHPAPRRKAGQIAPTIPSRSTGGGGLGTDFDCDGGLIASTGDVAHCLNAGGMGRIDYESETMIAHALRGEGFDASEDGTGRGTPLVPVAFQSVDHGADASENLSPTLRTHDPMAVAFSCKDYGGDAGETSPTLRAMGHDGSHANAGGQVAVAWALGSHAGAADGDQTNRSHDSGGPVGLGVQEGLAYSLRAGRTQSVATPWAVRRLTPRECERLQGFPQISEKVIFSVWSDGKLQPLADAESRCTTGQSGALSVDAGASPRTAKSVDQSFNTSQAHPAPPVALHVLLDCEREAVEIRNPAKLIWSASTAEASSASLLSMPPAVFARLVALTTQTAAKTTPDGRVVLPRNIERSTHLWSGERSVRLSGQEIAAHANAVDACISDLPKHSTFTTSPSIANIPTNASTLTTLCCCVLDAIGSFIPETIQRETSFSLLIETRAGFTRIPYRNKPADQCPDGPRYKALGNSWAINCGQFIFNRIQAVEQIMKEQAA